MSISSAAHRVLYNLDILYVVIDLVPTWDHSNFVSRLSQDGHRDVASLARVCKSFSDPALDLLWYSAGGRHGLDRVLTLCPPVGEDTSIYV